MHNPQAQSLSPGGQFGDSRTVVQNPEPDLVSGRSQADGDVPGASVPHRVVNRFLGDAVQVGGGLAVLRRHGVRMLEAARYPKQVAAAAREFMQGQTQPVGSGRDRRQAPSQGSGLFDGLLQ